MRRALLLACVLVLTVGGGALAQSSGGDGATVRLGSGGTIVRD